MAQPVIPGKTPAFIVTYAPSKLGKTTDLLYSFPRAFYIGEPAGLKPSEGVVGFKLHPTQVWKAPRIAAITEMLPKIPKEFDAIAIDDFSHQAERTLIELEKKHTGFKLWGALRDEILEFRDAARVCGKHVIMNCHESAPTTKQGSFIRGGPKLPGKLPEELPTHCDMVLRAQYEASRGQPWPVVYRCTPTDPNYVTGDRHGVTPDYSPLNLGEILRAAGYTIARAPGLDWMEGVVGTGADFLMSVDPSNPANEKAALQQIAGAIAGKYTKELLHIRWALRDIRDRVTLRRARASLLNAFWS